MNLKTSISSEVTIYRDAEWLFAFTQNFSERLKWDKQTKTIEFIEGHTTLKKGAKVATESIEGIRMETVYLSFDPPKEISIQMLNRSSVFKSFIGTWTYMPRAEGITTLHITYHYTLRFPYSFIPQTIYKKIKTNSSNKLLFLENYLENMS